MSKRIALSAMLVALALILSYVELLIPFSFGVPGIKLGLANLVVVTGLFFMKPGQVLVVLVTRIMLVSFMFGNMSSMVYSLAGGLLSLTVMLGLKRLKCFSAVGISMAGGVCHNIGQLLVAACVLENTKVFYYMPVLMMAGLVTGMLIGITADRVSHYLKYYSME